ncbi:MAG TPA: hypothetical protein VF534_30220 [Paraburkholderia sp.]
MGVDRRLFGKNLIHVRELCQWTRTEFIEMFTLNMDSKSRRRVRSLVWMAEQRDQRRSVLAIPISNLFRIPLHALTTEDLTGETLETLRERFQFDPFEVTQRAAEFRF